MLTVKLVGLAVTLAGAGICLGIANFSKQLGRRWQAGWLLVAVALVIRWLGDALAVYVTSHKTMSGPLHSLWELWGTGYPFTLQAALLGIGLAIIAVVYWQSLKADAESPEAKEIARLKREVGRRTHQIATLHAITADLNNTLDVGQTLRTALDRMADAVGADGGAVWVRLDLDGVADTLDAAGMTASPASGPVQHNAASNGAATSNGAAPAAQPAPVPAEQPAATAAGSGDQPESLAARIKADAARQQAAAAKARTASSGAATQAASAAGQRWRRVYARGTEEQTCAQALEQMEQALELGGIAYCSQASRSSSRSSGTAHVVPIKWKGEELGALGLVRREGDLEADERQLLDAIALEVGAALQNAQLYQDAIRLADRDGLTDLLNHRVVQQQLNINLSRSRRTSAELSVVMMDLKNFKFFNDTYGHKVGDQILQIVGRCLREACRVTDVLGRYGGDEFIAVLPDTDFPGAQLVCSRIAARVEKEGYQQADDGRRIPIALSFGAAVFPDDGDNVLELLAAANTNLEEAKVSNAPLLVQRAPAEEAQELRKLKDAAVGGAFGVLDALVTAIDNKDHYTRRHSEDVTHWATLMSRHLGHEPETQRAIRIAGLLHDVGKIAVPDAILRKPGRLNDDEFQIMQQHPVFGALIVKDVPYLEQVLGGIRHHHERYDGKGYPDKLKAEDTPMFGRLLAVPDCFSAMTTERPYRKALSWQEAINEIERGKGTQFDPAMAEAFLAIIRQIQEEKQAVSAAQGLALKDTEFGTATTNGSAQGPVVRPRSVTDAESMAAT